MRKAAIKGPWTRVAALALVCAVGAGTAAGAQEAAVEAERADETERISLRVTSQRPLGQVVVDRGRSDAVERGDRVLLFPRDGSMREATVVEVGERQSIVELVDRAAVIPDGTRGEVLVPRARLDALAPPPAPPPGEPAEGAPQAPPAGPQPPRWSRKDDEWEPGMPLLAEVGVVRPEERIRQLSGRYWLTADTTFATLDDRSDGFYRAGVDVLLENPFMQGGALHFDGELNYRFADVDGQVDDSDTRFRLDRLSYTWGGSRFDASRWEVGRFLQHGMPEFGVLDGIEYEQRLDSGDRFGASFGYMPEPNPTYDSGDDLQVAAYYRWLVDPKSWLSFEGGYQKTWHEGDSDRDLFVAKAQYLPPVGWSFQGTAFVDLYGTEDDVYGSGFELTEAHARAGHRWESGSRLDITYTKIEFPELLRTEFTPPADANALDQLGSDRLAVSGSTFLASGQRLHAVAGGWSDEDESGGSLELGVEVPDAFVDRSRTDLTAFAANGRFTSVAGGRVRFDRLTENGRWDVLYEIAMHDQLSFDADNDDLLQHWVRVGRDFHTESGWGVSLYAETRLWDEESSWSLGFHLQRSF